MDSVGRLLVVVGVVIVVVGLLFMSGVRIPFLGHLPGDLSIERDNVRVYLPIATSILISIIVTILMNLLFRRS